MMNEMKRFEAPALQVIALDPTDVIATSTPFDTVVKAVRREDVVDAEQSKNLVQMMVIE